MFLIWFKRKKLSWKIANPASMHREWVERAIKQGDGWVAEEELRKYKCRVRDWKNLGYDIYEFESEIETLKKRIQDDGQE